VNPQPHLAVLWQRGDPNMVTVSCAWCGKPKQIARYQAEKYRVHYCDIGCKAADQKSPFGWRWPGPSAVDRDVWGESTYQWQLLPPQTPDERMRLT
jgi:hypothetical protein